MVNRKSPTIWDSLATRSWLLRSLIVSFALVFSRLTESKHQNQGMKLHKIKCIDCQLKGLFIIGCCFCSQARWQSSGVAEFLSLRTAKLRSVESDAKP